MKEESRNFSKNNRELSNQLTDFSKVIVQIKETLQNLNSNLTKNQQELGRLAKTNQRTLDNLPQFIGKLDQSLQHVASYFLQKGFESQDTIKALQQISLNLESQRSSVSSDFQVYKRDVTKVLLQISSDLKSYKFNIVSALELQDKSMSSNLQSYKATMKRIETRLKELELINLKNIGQDWISNRLTWYVVALILSIVLFFTVKIN